WLRRNRERTGRVTEVPTPCENIGKRMARGLDWQSFPPAWWHRNIEIDRVRGDPVYGSLLAPESSTNDAHAGPIVIFDQRNVRRLHLLIARWCHFQRRRKIRPKLKTMHPTVLIAFRHLLMDNSASCSHPLDIAGSDRAMVSHAVAVLNR